MFDLPTRKISRMFSFMQISWKICFRWKKINFAWEKRDRWIPTMRFTVDVNPTLIRTIWSSNPPIESGLILEKQTLEKHGSKLTPPQNHQLVVITKCIEYRHAPVKNGGICHLQENRISIHINARAAFIYTLVIRCTCIPIQKKHVYAYTVFFLYV